MEERNVENAGYREDLFFHRFPCQSQWGQLSIFKDHGGWFAEVSPNFAHYLPLPLPALLPLLPAHVIFICAYKCFVSAFPD